METRVIRVGLGISDAEAIRDAAVVVDGGGLVAFPTETVYGIACRAKAESIARLDELKGGRADKAYTLHISDKGEVGRYVPRVGLRVRKLVERAWPGPLTMVFELDAQDAGKQRERLEKEVYESLYRDGSIGIRCPDNAIASSLLREAAGPVVAPSANLSGEAPAVDAAGVLAQLSGRIDVLLDGGPCRYKRSSTVVRVSKGSLQILRSGVYAPEELQAVSQVTFLFVCTGNTCRSPMAQGMFGKYLSEKLGCKVDDLAKMGYKVGSAGTIDVGGFPASPEAARACAAKGVDIRAHGSRVLSEQLIKESDVIFAMCGMHRDRVVALDSDAGEKCVLLSSGGDIPDPIGQPQEVYERCADLIEQAVKKRIGELVV
ncbi:MAG: L-threonylcarbamoyladenylate synthase [Planctomycetota bacterium]|jgi:tRNA threonylcarbamoyl adenosine modification protein (Sua5/YciO/YrdC/YwlC family)